MTHEQYREIFRIIDESLWEIICERDSDGWLKPFDYRIATMHQKCDEAKKIISEYMDRHSEMMEKMVTSEAFHRFPAPKRPPNQSTQESQRSLPFPIASWLEASEDQQAADAHEELNQ